MPCVGRTVELSLWLQGKSYSISLHYLWYLIASGPTCELFSLPMFWNMVKNAIDLSGSWIWILRIPSGFFEHFLIFLKEKWAPHTQTLWSRGAWWGTSDSGLLIDSDSGFDAKYEINNTLIVERVSAVQAKETWHFLLTLAFIPSDGISLSQSSLKPEHLIGIGNGVMAVSQTFMRWSTCALYDVLASNARTVHLLRAHAVIITPT